jgi:adenylate cyclase
VPADRLAPDCIRVARDEYWDVRPAMGVGQTMTIRILAVDDEPDMELLLRRKFRRQIREGEFELEFATDGQAALETIERAGPFDIIITDINMPRMDGLTLLQRLAEANSITKAIIVSAYGDIKNIRTAMNRGAFDFLTKPLDFEDLDATLKKTISHVNEIRTTIQSIRENNILKMYVDEKVLQFMAGERAETALMANETIEATVMFVDLCGFTAISERHSPDHVVAMLNSFFDLVVQVITEHKGYVDKFLGDGAMAVFKGEHHTDHALESALEIRERVQSAGPELGGTVEAEVAVTIGLHAGEMISGNIGSKSLARLDYTVIGDVVNTASRLQSIAMPNQIVIDQTVFDEVQQSFSCEKIGEVELKNKAERRLVYNVVS